MKKSIFILVVLLFATIFHIVGQEQEKQTKVDVGIPIDGLTLSIPLFGNAGATYDSSTGKYTICPNFKFKCCAVIKIVLFNEVSIDEGKVVLPYDQIPATISVFKDEKFKDFEELELPISFIYPDKFNTIESLNFVTENDILIEK